MLKKNIAFLAILILIVVSLSFALFFLRTRVVYLSKASGDKTEKGIPSLADSHLFASPLLAKPGDEKITISAFLLDGEGKGVQDKPIMVESKPFLTIVPVSPNTDEYGQAVFETTSASPGQFEISASYDGQPFPQTVTLTFR